MSIIHPFTPVDNVSRSQLVFCQIRDAIFGGQLKPGEPLRELHLAEEFKVSQATIREALMQLEKAGLVNRQVQKGTMVINMSDIEIRERIITRYHLEKLGCCEAAKHLTKEDFDELVTLDSKIQKAAKKNQYYNLVTSDISFHTLIWNKSGNNILSDTLERITIPLFATIAIRHSMEKNKMESLVNPHNKIIDALKSKNEDKIIKILEQDMKISYAKYL